MKYYKFCLWKAYFDKGYGLTSYFKWAIAIFGIASMKPGITLIGFVVYGFFSLILGKWWFKHKLVDAEHEVQNIVNPFVREMRKVYKHKS